MTEITSARPEGTPTWADLGTSDRQDAMRFYGELLGWEFVVGAPEYGYYTLCQRRGLPAAGLGDRFNENMPVTWTTYLASGDVDATCARVAEHGGSLLMEPMDVLDQGRMAIIQDPTGAVVGVWQARAHFGARIVREPGSVAWNELNTRDSAKAGEFYAAVFGLGREPVAGPPGFQYTMLKVGDDTVGGILGMDESWPAEIPPHWMTYFAVEDTDAACATVSRLGGKVQHGPFDSPYGRIAVVSDPQGAVFSLIRLVDAPPQG